MIIILSKVMFVFFLILAFIGGLILNCVCYECYYNIKKRKLILPTFTNINNPLANIR